MQLVLELEDSFVLWVITENEQLFYSHAVANLSACTNEGNNCLRLSFILMPVSVLQL